MQADNSQYITTPVTLITGKDDKGNEFAYAKSSFVPSGWIDLRNECSTTTRYVANYIIPSVVKVRFGNIEMTRQEWEANGCPMELSREQMNALEAEQHKAMKIVQDVASASKPAQPRYILSRSWADKHLNSDNDLQYFKGGAVIK